MGTKARFADVLSVGSRTNMYWVYGEYVPLFLGWDEPACVRTVAANGSYCTDPGWWMRVRSFGGIIAENGKPNFCEKNLSQYLLFQQQNLNKLLCNRTRVSTIRLMNRWSSFVGGVVGGKRWRDSEVNVFAERLWRNRTEDVRFEVTTWHLWGLPSTEI